MVLCGCEQSRRTFCLSARTPHQSTMTPVCRFHRRLRTFEMSLLRSPPPLPLPLGARRATDLPSCAAAPPCCAVALRSSALTTTVVALPGFMGAPGAVCLVAADGSATAGAAAAAAAALPVRFLPRFPRPDSAAAGAASSSSLSWSNAPLADSRAVLGSEYVSVRAQRSIVTSEPIISKRTAFILPTDFPLMSFLTLAAFDYFPLFRPPLQVRVRARRTASAAAATTTTTTTTAEVSVGVGVCVRVLLARGRRRRRWRAWVSGTHGVLCLRTSSRLVAGGRSTAVCVCVFFRPGPFVEFLVCSLVSFGCSISIWLARSRPICVFSAVFGRAVARKPPPLGVRCLFSGFVGLACFSSLSSNHRDFCAVSPATPASDASQRRPPATPASDARRRHDLARKEWGLPGAGLLGPVNNHGTSRPYLLLGREAPQFGVKQAIW